MRALKCNERGDTLIEILIAIVLIGLMMGALYASITLGASGSNTHKHLATADGLLRNYAEATKKAAKSCTSGGTFTVTAPTAPAGFGITSTPNLSQPQNCPSTTTGTGVLVVQLFVNVPNLSAPKELDVGVRTP
jgi:prepilin-type N-terminal cleavage/methylation domain-containing protein